MKPYREMRAAAWERTTHRWGWRVILTYTILAFVFTWILSLVQDFYQTNGIQTWADFNATQWTLRQSGLEGAVPSLDAALRMTCASGFRQLVEWLFGGIVVFGFISVLLKAVHGEERGWLRAGFGGFARPLGAFWLTALMSLRVVLWTCLFIVPGIIALYRYAMAWFVKAEHPDWSAGKCLAESSSLMQGHKWRLFVYSLTFLGWFVLAALAMAAAYVLGRLTSNPSVSIGAFALSLAGIGLLFFAGAYAALGQAVFYQEIKKGKQES